MEFKTFNFNEVSVLEIIFSGNKIDFDFYGYQHNKECILLGLKRLRTEKFTQENEKLIKEAIRIYWSSRKFFLSQCIKNVNRRHNKN